MRLSLSRFPVERQMDVMDCGPACLKIISKYYGKYFSLQYLRDACGISREGVSMQDICYGADKIGLRSLAVNINIKELCEKAMLPCIAHWDDNHFIVIYKISKSLIAVSDPSKGLIQYSYQDFVNKWYKEGQQSGAIILLEPSPEFRGQEEAKMQRDNKERMLRYFFPFKSSFITLFFIMLLVTALQGLLPFISKAVIDVGIKSNDIDFINLILIANITILISVTISNAIRDWLLLHITSRINIALISDYLTKLMSLPVTFFENKTIGDILQRAQDHERIRSFIMNNSLNLIFSTLTFIVFSCILMYFNKSIFFIFFIGGTIYISWVLIFLSIRKRLDWEYFDLISRNQSYWVETVNSIQDIKINNYEQTHRWKWETIQALLYRLNIKVLSITNLQQLGAQFVLSVKDLAITFFCAKAVISGEITFGVMISTQFIIGMLNAPLAQFVSFIISAQYAKISFMRLNEIHGLNNEEDVAVKANLPLPARGSIIINNVSFQYTAHSDYVLRQITMQIPKGKITAFVGGSGSGKTTMLKILLRMYQPSYGTVFLGDTNFVNVSLKEWRRHCGVVMQDGKVFSDTILNNIVLDEDKVDFERVNEVLNIANIGDEIKSMAKGLYTKIGENGRGLSGGQKQRILIARALYKDPQYLFLDEATNALDSVNEAKIVTALEQAFKNRTVVVVAHRLSTISNAHQIAVFNNGEVVEIGSHDRLLLHNGFYSELVQNQLSRKEQYADIMS